MVWPLFPPPQLLQFSNDFPVGFIYQFGVKDQNIREDKGQHKQCTMYLKISAS